MAETIRVRNLYRDLDDRVRELKESHPRVCEHRAVLEKAISNGGTHYGINTGFGHLASERIAQDDLLALQRNYLLSHAVGVGPFIRKELSRLILQLRIHTFGLGHSGVSENTFMRLIDFYERDLIPAVPEKGSVGASGDLAPLAHLARPLIGHGKVWNADGTDVIPAIEKLKEHNLEPLELQAKEGLALTNGTQFMLAYGAHIAHRAISFRKNCDIIAAMSVEGIRGSHDPFQPRVQGVRPHEGQKTAAANIEKLLQDSALRESHRNCVRVQDPYSFRCAAVVHGASRTALEHASDVIETELNSVTDNPIIFDDGGIVSAGNFHGQPLALAFDYAAIALAELANISERRIYFLIAGHDDLPLFLIEDAGLKNGFMIPQYTSAALVSENKVLCHPASVDSIPTSLGQEDHVSMGSIGATKLERVMDNAERVLSIELLCAAQALDFRTEHAPGRGVAAAYKAIREQVAHRSADNDFRDDFRSAMHALRSNALIDAAEKEVGELQ